MPPKKKKKKTKKKKSKAGASGPGAGNSADAEKAAELEALRSRLRVMKQQYEAEKSELNECQQEKDRLERFWMTEKERREQSKLNLRNKLKAKQDVEEKHAQELKMYKQKIKHLLYEQQTGMTDSKFEEQNAMALVKDAHRDDEHEVSLELRQIKVRRKEMELQHYALLNNLRQKHERSIMEMRQLFERRAAELKASYRKKEKLVRTSFNEQRVQDVKRIDVRKSAHIAKLMAKHKQAFDDIKNYYQDITHNNLDLIKTLKEEVSLMKTRESADLKDVNDVNKRNKKLSDPLQKNLALVEKLKREHVQYERDKQTLHRTKERILMLEEQVRGLEWEHEVLAQKHKMVAEEKRELETRLQRAIYDVQQKSGFQNLLLERKLAGLGEALEKTDAALSEVLASTNLQPDVIGNIQRNLESILADKEAQQQQIEDELADLTEQYNEAVHAYQQVFAANDIPLEGLGFTLAPLSNGHTQPRRRSAAAAVK